MKNKGPDTRQNRVNSNYNPFLERVKQVQVVKNPDPSAVHPETGERVPLSRNLTRENKDYGFILTEEVMANDVRRNWIVLLPKYLKPTRPGNPSDLRDDVFPAYNIGDQLFIGRLYVPINVFPALTTEVLQGNCKNTHELVVADYYQKDKSLSKGRVWNKVYPDIAAFYDHRVGNNPEYMAYYIDLNVDGRNRTPATTATSDEGKNAPNVWL
jgi:hypothetical protein